MTNGTTLNEQFAPSNGIELCYDTFGDTDNETILLVMGYTAQMIAWPEGMIQMLVDKGFHVVRFDNRDIGKSTKTAGDPPDALSFLTRAQGGEDISSETPYTLVDMANDALGLLDHLGIDKAHVVGASMGGMIVQELAINSPERLLSVTSIMSTTGNQEVGQADPEAMGALLMPPPTEPAALLEHSVKVGRVIGGPLFDKASSLARAELTFERGFHPLGAAFQLSAIAASGDRTEKLANVDLPFLVLHGQADRLIAVSGAHATKAAVPGADLVILDQMGHDLPEPLWGQITGAIEGIARRGPLG